MSKCMNEKNVSLYFSQYNLQINNRSLNLNETDVLSDVLGDGVAVSKNCLEEFLGAMTRDGECSSVIDYDPVSRKQS